MMLRLALALTLLASPTLAFERMQRADCQNMWIALTEQIFGFLPLPTDETDAEREAALRVRTTVTDDGWCRLAGGSPGLEDAQFETLDWQALDADRFIADGAPPTALRLRMTGVTGDSQTTEPLDIEATLRQVPGDGVLLVEALDVADQTGPFIALTAVLNGAFFESRGSTLSSLGGITLKQMVATVNVTPLRMTGDISESFTLTDDLPENITQLLDGLNDTQLPPSSRDALTALRDAMPDANGQLSLRGVSERGLGWMQVGMAWTFNPDATPAEILGFALSGVTLDFDWQPFE